MVSFLNFLPNPGVALCWFIKAYLPFPTALPPTHPLWVENPQGVWGGGAGVGDTKPPASDRGNAPTSARHATGEAGSLGLSAAAPRPWHAVRSLDVAG